MKKPFYKSKTILALVAAIIVIAVLPRLGHPVPEEYLRDVYLAITTAIIVGLRDGAGSLEWLPEKKDAPSNGAG